MTSVLKPDRIGAVAVAATDQPSVRPANSGGPSSSTAMGENACVAICTADSPIVSLPTV
jgi:hypothetical protein